ncbi:MULTISPECIES: chemotaxis protein CheW [unclassified Pseudomonas]|uniref:chemotaxis protein CheW n=1 Tax=unclassified Pseudomonas TaxID=196821 RepID=UPI000BCD1E77|nr:MULTISPECIES: chemotaxis protein CheW [unclassified Pseudomonas]PVZ16052.1 chemotaxis-related protein WspD [Pseudomonas sp. URIL14HWK12:I12]PVZ26092.1 chemotaxis-related protein WspD [Pseudomonas sp. URIL14HWK12:I10]PVZ36384.1 chemotaxis-related protein WspD [Pseudomonas sp. URIL14HWK12:I11]SNZ18446.1 chemotaxis-related protein WspD [Pseudomonas sp. URIL14HWK12:I9]
MSHDHEFQGLAVSDGDDAALVTCWNSIGVRGDQSCPKLVEYIRCLNCPVYAAAATRLLDRYALQRESLPPPPVPAPDPVASRSLVVFRLNDEWLGLASRCLSEVAPAQPVHSLPHQRSRALQGVANVRGALVPCLSLIELLGIDAATAPAPARRVVARMLILAAPGGAVVVPVDEVDGIHRFDLATLQAAAHAASPRFTTAVMPYGDRSLRVLDEVSLLQALARSLT